MAESSASVVKAHFNNLSTGDCVLQTPDGTQFVVHRLVLSLASQIWNDMFSLPQASEGSSSTRPVIPVEEDPETMEALLTMVYPLPPPRINSYHLATRLVQACDKYFIDISRLDNILYKVLRTTAALKANPLGVYALAWRLGLDDEAKEASRYTHRFDLNDPKIKSALIRGSGSVNSILTLWDLRSRREAALDELARLADINRSQQSGCGYHRIGLDPSDWGIEQHLKAKSFAKVALQEPYPRCCSVEQFFGVRIPNIGSKCGGCLAGAEGTHSAMKRAVDAALENYPQTITGILPDI